MNDQTINRILANAEIISKTNYIDVVSDLERLNAEIEELKLHYSEMQQTYDHLVSATWRERSIKKELNDRVEGLEKEINQLKLFYGELEATNTHLISATWRERDMKKQLKDAMDEISRSKEIIEVQNKRISDSINYARKIQTAINATEGDLLNEIPNSFILYKPKDIVSGDFPWYYKKGKYIYMAAVDCTGHGVPGAMMSMIGTLLLNDIVNSEVNLTPSQILSQLHHAVVRTLRQDIPGSHSNDGMDIAMCRINVESMELVFSGAHRPLVFLREGQTLVVPGDKFPIGGMHHKGKNEYNDYFFELKRGDKSFIYSDGYVDQFGGPDGRKFLNKSLADLIEANAHLPLDDFKHVLGEAFDNWKGSGPQTDDVIMIGFEV